MTNLRLGIVEQQEPYLTNMSNLCNHQNMSKRNEYPSELMINGRFLSRVVIDQHYQLKHPEISDKLILKLIEQLNEGNFPIEEEKSGYEYFAVEPVTYEDKPYRLVLLLYVHDDFLGVVNAFRVGSK